MAECRLAQLRRSAQAHQGLSGRSAEAAREAFGEVLVGRKVYDVLGLDDLTGDVVYAAQRIGQAELDAPLSGPEQSTEQLRRFLQALAASLLDHVDELPVDVRQELLGVVPLLWVHRRERIQKPFVLPGG